MTHWDMLHKKIQYIGFVYHVPVRHLLSSWAILHHVIAQLQEAHLGSRPSVLCIDREGHRSVHRALFPRRFRRRGGASSPTETPWEGPRKDARFEALLL